MNERDVQQFDFCGVKSILSRFNETHAFPTDITINKGERPLLYKEIDDLAKQIIEYAALCGVIPPQSTMKRG